MRRVPAGAPPKIRLNAILNGVTRRGPFLGNSAGVVAMMYNGWSYGKLASILAANIMKIGVNSYIGYLRGKRRF